jgi:hypothetical protein
MDSAKDFTGRVVREGAIPAVPRPGDYYVKARAPEDGDTEPLGELVLVLRADGDEIRYRSLNEGWKSSVADFLLAYDYDPEGADKREDEIRAVRRELRDLMRQAGELKTQADEVPVLGVGGGGAQHLLGGEGGGAPEGAGGGLVPTGALASRREQTVIGVERTKLHVANTRNEIQRFLGKVAAAKTRLELLLAEHEAMFAALDKLSGLVRRLNKVVAYLNVYLGVNEEIVQLREGPPAPPDTRISVRQLVLFADEECAIAADEGGISWEDIEKFDEWVCRPENLRQVLPERKGIVAFKPRRNEKHYTDDSFVNAMMNARNRKTYFLIVNGEAIYRIASEVEVGDYLFATEREFDELFVSQEYAGKGKFRSVRLRPGSREFADAMEKADEKARMYGMVALLVQGLIDRTDVFRPFEFDDINILDVARHEQFISYVRDAEKVLLTGRPKFRAWLRELNQQIDVGQRIVGVFDMYGYGLRYESGRCHRLSPGNATLPNNYSLHTVERRTEDSFYILYERGERRWEKYTEPVPGEPGWVYKRHREVAFKKRAACELHISDGFFIPFDLVRAEDIEYYLSDRVERSNYTQMFPLLRTVLKLKERERREEEPLRTLLIGQIMRRHDAAREDAEAAVDDLICWYKAKIKFFRSLRKEDGKAVRMIVAEYGLKRKREAEREARRREEQRIVEAISSDQPEVIFIGHKRADVYVALVAENAENIFVREQEWRWDSEGGGAALKEEKRWRTVDKRRERWAPLWTGARWERWGFDANARRYLTDPEREELAAGVWELARQKTEKWNEHESDRARRIFVPVALAITPKHTLHCYFADKKGIAPRTVRGAKGGAGIKEPRLSRLVLRWQRDRRGGVCFATSYSSDRHDAHYAEHAHGGYRLPKPGKRPWDYDKDRRKGAGEHGEYRVLWVDERSVERLDADWQRVLRAQSRAERLDELVYLASGQVDDAILAEIHRRLRERYDADHNPPELWQAYLEKQRIGDTHSAGFRKAVERVLHNGGQINGKTVCEIAEMAAALGVEIEAKEAAALPFDLVISTTKRRRKPADDDAEGGEVDEDDSAEEFDGGDDDAE